MKMLYEVSFFVHNGTHVFLDALLRQFAIVSN